MLEAVDSIPSRKMINESGGGVDPRVIESDSTVNRWCPAQILIITIYITGISRDLAWARRWDIPLR